jgi:hypothetical protein
MSNLHPKLNWEAFQQARNRRKRRRWLLWFAWVFGGVGIPGFIILQLALPISSVDVLPAKHSEKLTAVEGQLPDNLEYEIPVHNHGEAPRKPKQKASGDLEKRVTFHSNRSLNTTVLATLAQPSALENLALNAVKPVLNEAESTTGKILEQPVLKAQLTSQQNQLVAPDSVFIDTTLTISKGAKASKKRFMTELPLWLSVAWSPWHNREFILPALSDESDMTYTPLQSVNVSLRLDLYQLNRLHVTLEPQFLQQRFFTELTTSFSMAVYAPGSVVGYLQTSKGIEQVISDSVSGIRSIQLRKIGSQSELLLPISVSASLLERGAVQLMLAASVGLHYHMQYRGSWFDGEQLVSLEDTPANFGFLGAGSLSVNYQPGLLRYSCSLVSSYRTLVRSDQLPFRSQLWIGVSLPLQQ